MEQEFSLRELRPFKISRLRHFFFCKVGYGVCVINPSYSFQCIFLKPCTLVVDIMNICMWTFDGPIITLREIRPFELSHFRQDFALLGMEFV